MIESIISWIEITSQGNESIAGAMTLAIGGLVSFLISRTPRLLQRFIYNRFTMKMTINSVGDDARIYRRIKNHMLPNCTVVFSRSLKLIANIRVTNLTAILGYGIHWVYYEKVLYIINIKRLPSDGSDNEKECIEITTLGPSDRKLLSLTKSLEQSDTTNKVLVNTPGTRYGTSSWRYHGNFVKRGFDKLALDDEVRNTFKNEIELFLSKEEEFLDLGVPYKLTYMLHGQPGTGKSGIIKAIASEYDLTICTLDLSTIDTEALTSMIACMSGKTILLLEDIDSTPAVHKRGSDTQNSYVGTMTLSAILNALDGICSLHNVIVIMTTNHLEVLDPALYRKGRVDKVMEIPKVSSDTVKSYFQNLFPELRDMDITYSDMLGCDINNVLLHSKIDRTVIPTLLDNNYNDVVKKIAIC